MKRSTIVALFALASVAALGAYLATRSPTTSTSTGRGPSGSSGGAAAPGEAFLPALAARLNEAASISITRPELSFTVHKVGDTWRLKEKGDYPVKAETARALIIALADLKVIEPKTARPDLYSKIGVEDPIAPAPDSADKAIPQATLVAVSDASGAALCQIILGNKKYAQSPGASGIFVRRSGEAQSWLCLGQPDAPRDQLAWIDTQFANIDRTRIKSAIVQPGTSGDPGVATPAAAITVDRAASSDPFRITLLPEGKVLKDPNSPESIASALTFATLIDVARIDQVSFVPGPGERAPSKAELRTFDGLVLHIDAITRDAKTWWKLSARLDEVVARARASLPPDPSTPTENVPTQEQIDSKLAALRAESETLNIKWGGFAFAPQEFKARPLNSTLNDLVKDPDPPAPVAAPEGTTPENAPVPITPPAQGIPGLPQSPR